MEPNNQQEVPVGPTAEQITPNVAQLSTSTPSFLTVSLVISALLIGAGGTFWYMQSRSTDQPVQNAETAVDDTQANQMPSTIETSIVGEEYVTPAGYQRVEEAQLGMSFDVPANWVKSKEPQSGRPSYATPDFSSKSMNVTGAYISYDVYAVPQGYSGTPDQYLESLKGGLTGWKEMTIDGYSVLVRTPLPDEPKFVGTQIIGKVNSRFIGLHFVDATNANQVTFNNFLISLDIR